MYVWNVRDDANNACRCGMCQESKGADLEDLVQGYLYENGGLIDEFTIKLTTIVNDIHLLGDRVEEIFVIEKFF